MDLLDMVLVVGIVAAVIGGYRLGFITRSVSWIGLAVGLFVAVRVAPPLLHRLDSNSTTLLALLTIGFVLIGASLGQAAGFVIGGRISPRSRDGLLGASDRILGAAAGFAGAVAIVWLLVPILAVTPGWLAHQTTGSVIARTISARLPEPPDAMQALRSAFGADAFPDVFAALRPTPELGPPPESSGLDARTATVVARSIVKVEGAACSRIQDGSGFVVSDGLIVTNAHVVAGERSTEVIRDDDRHLAASVVAFDADRDLALLSVPTIDRPALELSTTTPANGSIGGVFGHPGGAPLRIAPFEVARSMSATGRDIHGVDRTTRAVLELSSALRPGDSGSALVDPAGTVVGVAFAIARDVPNVAYALAPSELRALLAEPTTGPVSTGACLN